MEIVLMRMQRSRKQSPYVISMHLIFFYSGPDETNEGVGNYQAFGIDQVPSE